MDKAERIVIAIAITLIITFIFLIGLSVGEEQKHTNVPDTLAINVQNVSNDTVNWE